MTLPATAFNRRDLEYRDDSVGLSVEQADTVIQIVGVGSPFGDDQIGWLVAESLAQRIALHDIPRIASRSARSPVEILDWLSDTRRLIVIDACTGLAMPGQCLHFCWPANEFESLRGGGSHDFNLWQTLAVANSLNMLTPRIDLWCVEGRQFGPEQPLSTTIVRSIAIVTDEIWLAIATS